MTPDLVQEAEIEVGYTLVVRSARELLTTLLYFEPI